MRKLRHREHTLAQGKAGVGTGFGKSGSKPPASLVSSGCSANSHGPGRLPRVFASGKHFWAPRGGSSPVPKCQVRWGEAPPTGRRKGVVWKSWGEGSGHRHPARPCQLLGTRPPSSMTRLPAGPQVPGLLHRAGSGCLPMSRPDKNLLFHVPAPALEPG